MTGSDPAARRARRTRFEIVIAGHVLRQPDLHARRSTRDAARWRGAAVDVRRLDVHQLALPVTPVRAHVQEDPDADSAPLAPQRTSASMLSAPADPPSTIEVTPSRRQRGRRQIRSADVHVEIDQPGVTIRPPRRARSPHRRSRCPAGSAGCGRLRSGRRRRDRGRRDGSITRPPFDDEIVARRAHTRTGMSAATPVAARNARRRQAATRRTQRRQRTQRETKPVLSLCPPI